MCETTDSAFPVPSRGVGVADAGDFHLEAADGNRPMAYFARAAQPRGIGVVIIPARLGLLAFYKQMARRFAEEGIDAVAFDQYGRTAGDGKRDDDFPFEDHYGVLVDPASRPGIDADVAAAVDFLQTPAGGAVDSLFTVGFCFGGSVSWWQSAVEPRLAGCIGLYGAPKYVAGDIDRMRAPLLLLVAGADAFVSANEMSAYERDLQAAGVRYESRVYPGAPHSFFDRRFSAHDDAVRDAWDRILAFIAENGRPGS